MKNPTIVIILIILIIVIFVGGLAIGYYLFKPAPATKVISQVILESLQSRGFLVTQSVLAEQKITIVNKTGNLWKDLIWGQEITASALMKTSLGVDLTALDSDSVKVSGNKITVVLPPVEVQSIELASEINLDNNQGILKKLLDNNDGYNDALNQLRSQAQQVAMTENIQTKTREEAEREISRLVNFLMPQSSVEFK
jgi:hypothetical protein